MSDWHTEDRALILKSFRESVFALERIAAALEERLPTIEDASKIEALQARCLKLAGDKAEVEHEVKALKENQDKLITKIGELREENNRLRLLQPDLMEPTL